MLQPTSYEVSVRFTRASRLGLAAAVLGLVVATSSRPAAQVVGLSGTWTLDRNASQFPREIGFDAGFAGLAPADNGSGGRGRNGGRRSGGGSPSGNGVDLPLRPRGESYDEAQRRDHLTDEVRTPPARLTIVELPDLVTFSDEAGNVRSVHPDGRAETISVAGTSVLTVAHREDGKLIVLYSVGDLRHVRYTYSRPEGQASLAVDVEFVERSKAGDTVRRVYNPPPPAAATAAASAPNAGAAPASPPAAAANAPKAVVPRAGAEFTGLKRVGIVVEELSTQAMNCGMKRETLEAAVAKPLTDAGMRTSVNSDEDTYVHVTLMTSVQTTGMCVTRYDWALYSITDATLSYQHSPLLSQVLLAHRGGLAMSLPGTHAAEVMRGLTDGLTQVAGTIRDANK
jgi:hypothetical protein